MDESSAQARHEDALVARARAGEAGAFEELIERYDRQLRGLAFRLLEDRAAMDDVLQEAYVKAFVGLSDFSGRSAFGTWLYRIVYNTALDELKRRKRRPLVRLDDLPEPAGGGSGLDESSVERLDLAAALATLDPDLRALVIMVNVDGLDYAEAAEVLGVPPGTVGSRLNRARRTLRAALSDVESEEAR